MLGMAIANPGARKHIKPSDFSNPVLQSYYVDLVNARDGKPYGLFAFVSHYGAKINGFVDSKKLTQMVLSICRLSAHQARIARHTQKFLGSIQFCGNDHDLNGLINRLKDAESQVLKEEEMIDAQIAVATQKQEAKESSEPGAGEKVSSGESEM